MAHHAYIGIRVPAAAFHASDRGIKYALPRIEKEGILSRAVVAHFRHLAVHARIVASDPPGAAYLIMWYGVLTCVQACVMSSMVVICDRSQHCACMSMDRV